TRSHPELGFVTKFLKNLRKKLKAQRKAHKLRVQEALLLVEQAKKSLLSENISDEEHKKYLKLVALYKIYTTEKMRALAHIKNELRLVKKMLKTIGKNHGKSLKNLLKTES